MKIILFDDILETHVRRSLARALRNRGHDVTETPAIWKGHSPPSDASDINWIDAQLKTVIQSKPDMLLNFRAATLTPHMLEEVRAADIISMVWLPDDPVLYKVCYRDIVEHYDIVLNCGGREILDFYQDRHGIRGINFPFWTDNTEFPRVRSSNTPNDYDIAFLGNLKGHVRQRRYDMIAALPGRIRIFGKADKDPRGLVQGYLNSEVEVAQALATARMALNIPQIFKDYRGHQYDFDALARMGSFEYPSRVVQYAALGLPVFTLGLAQPPSGFPEMLTAASVETAVPMLHELLAEPERLASLSEQTHERFLLSFSAEARAILIERLLAHRDTVLASDLDFRAEVFANPAAVESAAPMGSMPEIVKMRHELADCGIDARSKFRIVFCFPDDTRQEMEPHLRALRHLGHAVVETRWATDCSEVLKIARSFRAGLAIFVGSTKEIPPKITEGLQRMGCHVSRFGTVEMPMPIGVDLAWMVESSGASMSSRLADVTVAGSRQMVPRLQSDFDRVEIIPEVSEDARPACLDRALVCVVPEEGPTTAVHEAIARCLVVLAQDTHQLRACFKPDEEVIFYRDTVELSQRIAWILSDPEERKRIIGRAFKRLAETELLEHQWNTALSEVPAPAIDREVRVLVTGYYGHENLGDELILDSLIDVAAKTRPELSFCIATAAAETLRFSRGIETVDLGNVTALARLAPTVDAAILGGGGLWHDYSFRAAGGVRALYDGAARSIGGYARPNLMAAACGAECHVYGVGVGPLSDPDAMVFLKHIAGQTKSITVRDAASRDLLQSIPNWSSPISVAPDMVYALDLASMVSGETAAIDCEWSQGHPILLINLRDWAKGDVNRLIDRITTALEGLFREKPYALLGLPMQEKGSADARVLERLFSRLPESVPRRILRWQGDSSMALKAIAQADFVLAMRLHTCLIAHRLGKPVVGCSYDPKVTAHFQELGREAFLFNFETRIGQLECILKQAARETGTLPEVVVSRIKVLETASYESLARTITDLPSARPGRKVRKIVGSPRTSNLAKKKESGLKRALRKLLAQITGR